MASFKSRGVKEHAKFDNDAFMDAMRNRALSRVEPRVEPQVEAQVRVPAGRAERAMARSSAQDMPRCTDSKSFDHAAFEAKRPKLRGYNLQDLTDGAEPMQGFEPYITDSYGTLGCPLDAADRVENFDAYGSAYSDLRSAYQPDVQHHMHPAIERTLEQVVADRNRTGKVVPNAATAAWVTA